MKHDARSDRDPRGAQVYGPLRKFEGSSAQEAYQKMLAELGADAVVLHSRSFKRGGVFGVGAREIFEITASLDARVADRRTAGELNRKRAAGREYAVRTRATASPSRDPIEARVIETELASIRGMLGALMRRSSMRSVPDVSDALVDRYIRIVENGVEEDLARRVVRRVNSELSGESLHDAEALHVKLVEVLAAMMPVAGGLRLKADRCKVVCLMGPTGVGKTTTLAKLAASYAIGKERRVGIVTADTYRIAAVEQLQRYANLMGVPLRTVLSPVEARKSIQEFSDFDLVLVDTAGRSQRDQLKMNELAAYLGALGPHETHLVLSATSRGKAIEAAASAFGRLGVDRLIVTKLDEAEDFGFLPKLALKVGRELSYVTNGQRVPEDIVAADSMSLAELVVRKEAA